MRIGGEIKPRRPSLDPGQCDLLDRIEADRAQTDRLNDGISPDILRNCLHQPQNLNELALAALAQARLHQMTQMLEGLGQSRRNRVIIATIAHQRRRRDAGSSLLASLAARRAIP